MKKKSIGINAILNMIRTVCQVVFPFITFPYVSRVLHLENLGRYNFCQSIISYFSLAASLGISTYAVREGARYRDDRRQMSEFASEVFSVNLISTILSYVVFALCVIFIPRLNEESSVLVVLSISIFFTTIGCEWVFQVFEEFGYIALRGVIFQIISIILMFCFVRTRNDLVPYAAVSVISSSGANIINAFARRKYCRIRFVVNRQMMKRLVPILILFANTVATTIYTSSDMTMLGIMADNRATGLYSVSTKIYNIVKQMLAALIIVSVPRLSSYLGNRDKDSFDKTANQILNALIVLVVPVMVGIFALSRNIILIISGREYIRAESSLRILSIALLFSIFSWFYTSCILIPYMEEGKVLKATIIAASVNIGLNFVLIPFMRQDAAALTTVIAEFISMVMCFAYGRKYFRADVRKKDIIAVISGCLLIGIICFLVDYLMSSLVLSTILSIGISVLVYLLVMLLTKNQSVFFIMNMIKHRENVSSAVRDDSTSAD